MTPDELTTWAETLRTFAGLGMGPIVLAFMMGLAKLIDRIWAARKTEAEARAIDATTAREHWVQLVEDLERRNTALQQRLDYLEKGRGGNVSTDLRGGSIA